MGLICSKLAPDSVKENQERGTTEAAAAATSSKNEKDAKSLAYFDAEEEPLKNELESIRENFRGSVYFEALENIEIDDEEEQEAEEPFRYAPATAANRHPRASVAFDQSDTLLKSHHDKKKMAASTVIMQELKQPTTQQVSVEGYPGDLTKEELDACLLFRRRLKKKDPAYYDMVLALSPAEEEPYAICRFMRARNFQVDAAIEMMDESIDMWKDAEENDFHTKVEDNLGITFAVFSTQFPFVRHGLAKNGTVNVYLRAGRMTIEGAECLVEIDSLSNWMWWAQKHKLKNHVITTQEENPQVVVRCEETYVIDLKHLTSSQVSKTAIDTLKSMFAPSACFPEVLNKIVILNAPGFFSFIWRVVKVFLHPRTARKVEIFSDTKKGNRRLKELIDPIYIPSDFDGQATSYEEIMRKQYCGEGRRQIHQLLSTARNGKAKWEFALNAKEQASIRVYTRSSEGADFTISSGSKTVAQVFVGGSGKSGPYWKEIASKLEGPGQFVVTARPKSSHTDHFLLIASISG